MGIFLQVHYNILIPCMQKYDLSSHPVIAVVIYFCYRVPTSLRFRKELSSRKIVGDGKPAILAQIKQSQVVVALASV